MFSLESIAKNLASTKTCPAHGKHPKLISASKDKVSFECCCQTFHDSLAKEMQKSIADNAAKELKSILKKGRR